MEILLLLMEFALLVCMQPTETVDCKVKLYLDCWLNSIVPWRAPLSLLHPCVWLRSLHLSIFLSVFKNAIATVHRNHYHLHNYSSRSKIKWQLNLGGNLEKKEIFFYGRAALKRQGGHTDYNLLCCSCAYLQQKCNKSNCYDPSRCP